LECGSTTSPFHKTPSFFSRFKQAPFDFVNDLSLSFLGIEWNFIKRAKDVRRVVFLFAHVIFIVWFLLGFDSCQSQFEFVLVNLPSYFQGKLSLDDLTFIYNDQYGKGMHYSAWVIYGFMFWALSRYYDKKLGVTKSRNFALSFAFVLLSVAAFETFWHHSFAHFQDQPWVTAYQWPQLKILVQNVSFFFLGFSMIFVMYVSGEMFPLGRWKGVTYVWGPITNFPSGLQLNFGKWLWICLLLTLLSVCVWYRYGDFFPVETLKVPAKGYPDGVWVSSPYFPQTVYTVETDLTDDVNAGDQFFVENDLLHGVNTLCKVFMTSTFYCLGRVKKRG